MYVNPSKTIVAGPSRMRCIFDALFQLTTVC